MSGSAAPQAAELHAYHAANWGSFAFGILGKLTFLFPFSVSRSFVPSAVAVPSDAPFVLNGQRLEKAAID